MIDLAKNATAGHTATSITKNSGINRANKEQFSHNLYHALLTSDLLTDLKKPERMAHEGFVILLAGSDTTARTMGVAVYHLIANPHLAQRSREELKTVMPRTQDTVELKVLQELPWLVSLSSVKGKYACLRADNEFSLRASSSRKHYELAKSLIIGSVSLPQKRHCNIRIGSYHPV